MSHPARLGKYRIDAVLGEGAMGVVYQGYDPDIQRPVAIKTIRRELTDGSSHGAMIAARFRNEAQAAGRLSHPGIVAVYDYGEDGPVAYIAMEFVRGRSIARHLADGERFADDRIPGLMAQLLDALDHAHAHRVWHRDIKPANVILTNQARLKLADFGTARIEDVELTQSDMVIGTPSYMAPEQFLGLPVDARTDVYGAGVLLYVLLAGRPPFAGASTEALMYQVVHAPPRPPSAVDGAQRPRWYDDVVARALAKDPRDRYPSAAAFRRDLLAAGGAATDDGFEKTVVLAAPLRPAPAADPHGAGRDGPAPPSEGTGATPVAWDAATLARVEASLARHVGPMATVLVRRAARECDTPAALYARLAGQIADSAARQDFLARSGTAAVSAPVQSAAASAVSPRPGVGPATVAGPVSGAADASAAPLPVAAALDGALLARTQQLLAQHVGPIAGILVKKAAAAASDRADFVVRVSGAVADPAARARVIAELERLS